MRASYLAAAVILGALGGVSTSQAEQFDLETAIIESATAKAVGGGRKSGEINTFFVAQKEMVFAALTDLGIALDSLPLDVRRNLERYQTTNFAAFRMFSLGLNAQDQGKFAEAKAFFEKAVELDPDFELAGELVVAMPTSNAVGTVQLQAALVAASRSASTSGKTQVEIDLSGAIAALQSGQNVVLGVKSEPALDAALPTSQQNQLANPPGSATTYADRKVVGISYSVQSGTSVGIATTNEWTLDQLALDSSGALTRVGDVAEFLAVRGTAANVPVGSTTLGDGSKVSWGYWQSGSGAFTVSSKGSQVSNLGPQFQYLLGDATRAMPQSGTATYTPGGGFFTNANGSIGVNFLNQSVQLNNLGFDIAGLRFVNLNGAATYSNSIGSGFFKGNFASGSCNGCTSFSPTASAFTGNFVGAQADGLVMSTVLSVGNGTVSGTHLYRK